HTLTAILEAHRVAGIVGFGVAGAYPSSGLATESVAVAERQIYGDEGVRTPEGWWSCEGIGIPLVEDAAAPIFNDFPIEESAVDVIVGALAGAGISAARGPFVTVSCCSGTRAAGEELEQRFGAICETMEGAAYAHVARLYDVPYVEIRGISNLVEDRDFTRWRLAQAAAAAADATAIAAGAWHPRSASSIATVQT